MQSQNVEVTVVRGGDELPLKEHGQDGKTYVEARDGTEYAIRIKNNNPYRVLVVPSVDGLSALDGKAATPDGSGYILEAYGKLVVKGFRKDNDSVGAFKFVKKEGSYAASKGDSSNVGVIAVAVFKEKQKAPLPQIQIVKEIVYRDRYRYPWQDYPYWKYPSEPYYWGTVMATATGGTFGHSNNSVGMMRSMSFCAPSATQEIQCSAPSENSSEEVFAAGTSWGSKVQDRVVNATFEKEHANPMAVFEIYYAFKSGLEALGIKIAPEKQVAFPKGFPGQFAEPPKDWVG